MGVIRLLFLSDTHLGFDMPQKPRIQRRRRGEEFFIHYHKALEPAFSGDVDGVVHGGDIFFRSRVPVDLVQKAFAPLTEIASQGVPVYVVPGNHERSSIPYRLIASHSNIHIFDTPRSYILRTAMGSILFTGFPYERDNIRRRFPDVMLQTGWKNLKADIYLLCIHHCVEGASVGTQNYHYTFRYTNDVIKINDIPVAFTAVLSGHIHRYQVLQKDHAGNRVSVPVIYAGSTERTSFQESGEQKGYVVIEINAKQKSLQWTFHPLKNRPMFQIEINAEGMGAARLKTVICKKLDHLHSDSIVKLRILGELNNEVFSLISASSLRAMVPTTMNIEAVPLNYRKYSTK
ncbi:MAG: metallophosphoesterase [Nitrospiraceae bacterium]|nr:MAG: metallophosphoesterase [Nitrospiraceae bacterium]